MISVNLGDICRWIFQASFSVMNGIQVDSSPAMARLYTLYNPMDIPWLDIIDS
jgi:hypothetical protein